MPRPTGWAHAADRVVLAAMSQPTPTPMLRDALLALVKYYGEPLTPPQQNPRHAALEVRVGGGRD